MLRLFLSCCMALSVFFITNAAVAAPQVLAVLSTGNGAAMECEGEICKATLSTYCLQRHRESPSESTVYHAADPTRYSLVLNLTDGSEKIINIDSEMVFRSSRGFRAVNAFMPKSVLSDHGATGARLLVEAEASLIPEPEPDDLNPLTEQEIAEATGPLRSLGARVLDAREGADTARALATVLRGIPEWRGWPELENEELWQRIAKVSSLEKITVETQEIIQHEFDNCVAIRKALKTYGVGYCLMQRHDDVMMELNKKYWETQAGS